MASYSNPFGTNTGCFFSSIPSNSWKIYTLTVKKEPNNHSTILFFREREVAPNTPFPAITFPRGNVRFSIGGGKTASVSSPGQIGPFAFLAGVPDVAKFFSYPFQDDPNFERFKNATFTSDYIQHAPPNSRYKISAPELNVTPDFLDIFVRIYDLNYWTYSLTLFRQERILCPIELLQIILRCLAASPQVQDSYLSVPVLASILPSILGSHLDFSVYMMFYNFIPSRLAQEMLDHIILNIEIWMACALESIKKIIDHWKTEVLKSYQTAFLRRWHVRRLLALFAIIFFSETEQGVVDNQPDIAIQTSLADSVREQTTLHSVTLYHTADETEECRELYLQYIVAVGTVALLMPDVDSLYSHLVRATSRAGQVMFLRLVGFLGQKIAAIKDVSFNPVPPLLRYLKGSDVEMALLAVLAICELSQMEVHFVLSLLPDHINQPAELFRALLPHIPKFPNLYSLLCLISVSLGESEREDALNVSTSITASRELQAALNRSEFSSIWPLALGLMCNINANFVSMPICRDANILNRFAVVLDSIIILARGARSTGNSLVATVTFLVCRDMFANSEERDEPYLTMFFLICYRYIFFQSHTSP
jgi:hypothetical protein